MPRASGSGPPGPDSASSQADLINTLEGEGVRFSLTADQDAAVTALLHELPEVAWTEPVPGCGYELAEAVYTMTKSHTAFRLILTREIRRQLALLDGPSTLSTSCILRARWS